MKTKPCSKCRKVKDLSEFYWIASRGRYHSQCKDCRRASVNTAYDNNSERQREYHRARYATDPEACAKSRAVVIAWLAKNPGKAAEYTSRHRALMFANGPIDDIDRRAVWGRDEGHCRIRLVCDGIFVPFETMHLDHIIPLSKGGTHTWDNVQTGCAPCNLSKNARILVGVN